MTRQPRLIILCGLPFAGKTTLAKSLSRALGFGILSYDHDIYAVHRHEVPPGTSKASEFELVQAIARDRLRSLLAEGHSIIYDDLCLDPSDRQSFLKVAHDCHAQPLIIFVDTPLTTIEQRRQANQLSNHRDHIDDATMQLDISLLQPPTPHEPAIRVTPDQSLNDILDAVTMRLN